jgi:predicted CXXCH cytochrome family protein
LKYRAEMLAPRPSNRARPLFAAALLALLTVAPPGLASSRTAGRGAPIAPEQAVSEHAPFAAGECGTCHRDDAAPSAASLLKPPPGLCVDCHEDFHEGPPKRLARRSAGASCTSCHSPHNSTKRKLLL